MILWIALFIAAFLVGGIPTGFLVVRLMRKRDIREQGSGNIGFSNVYRSEGLLPSAIVLVVDVGKAFAATYFIALLFPHYSLFRLLIGITVILGNVFSPFLKFKGGKGVASALGVTLALNPFASLCALVAFIFAVKLSRYMSVGSLVAVSVYLIASSLFYAYADYDIYTLIFAVLIFILIVTRHISNIKRLIHGQENRIGSGQPR
jgi:glycerol-3-phosphate acyltransferase PlsY